MKRVRVPWDYDVLDSLFGHETEEERAQRREQEREMAAYGRTLERNTTGTDPFTGAPMERQP